MRKFQSLAIDPKHQQSLAHLSNYSDSEKKSLLQLLIENRVGLRDVKRFSQAFKLVPLEAITMYVNTRMTGWKITVLFPEFYIEIFVNCLVFARAFTVLLSFYSFYSCYL